MDSMDCHSRRFQMVRQTSYSNLTLRRNRTGGNNPTRYCTENSSNLLQKNDKFEKKRNEQEVVYQQQETFKFDHLRYHQKQAEQICAPPSIFQFKSWLWHYILLLLGWLYALTCTALSTCFTATFRLGQKLISLTCQKFIWLFTGHVKFEGESEGESKPESLTNLVNSYESVLNDQRRRGSAQLYSSDEEDDCDCPGIVLTQRKKLGWLNERDGGILECNVDQDYIDFLIDDDELPFLSIVDNIVYFFNLFLYNYPAFKTEFSSTLYERIFLSEEEREFVNQGRSGGGWFRHNFDPSKWRTNLLKKGVSFLKRREFNARMGRATGDYHRTWVLKAALLSRVIIFAIQMASRSLPEVFRHNNDGFKFTPEADYGKFLDPFVNSTFGGYVNWDANYFLHISVYGYSTENIMAFFPLLPMIVSAPSRVLYLFLSPVISLSSIVIVVGVVLNMWLFVLCAGNIYELACLWSGGSLEFTTAACLMFCFNPASIFFSGLYSETLFAFLTSKVVVALLERDYATSLICSALSGLCRSNGLLNAGFIIALLFQREMMKRDIGTRFLNFIIRSILILALSIVPFLLYQKYGIDKFCKDGLYEPDSLPLYCINSWTLPYSYIQKKYWNVGFLEYFQVKQIPNFILAFPALYFLGTLSWTAMKISLIDMKNQRTLNGIYYSAQALHGLFLTFFCFFFVHVQVSTRMIMSACPYLYLFVADSNLLELERFRNREIVLPIKSFITTIWCLVYYVAGTIGFSLGLPWT